MRRRRDGEATRQRLLEAACSVFGEKGFHQATHAEIGEVAGVNPALINFHFGSKDGLYRAVWSHVCEQAERLCPHDGGVPCDAPASERLGGMVRALVRRGLEPAVEPLHRIRAVEMVHPTGLLDDAMAAHLARHRGQTLAVLRELLGPHACEEDVLLCEMSVVSQCRGVSHRRRRRGRRPPPWEDCTSSPDDLVGHITTFSLAGIEAIRRRIEAREVQRSSGSNRREAEHPTSNAQRSTSNEL